MKGQIMGRCIRITRQGYLRVGGSVVRVCGAGPSGGRTFVSVMHVSPVVSDTKSVRGSPLASAAGFWRRVDTGVVFPVEGWSKTTGRSESRAPLLYHISARSGY
jgi:hypothetical protein